MRHWKIGSKLAITFTVIVILVLCQSVIQYFSMSNIQHYLLRMQSDNAYMVEQATRLNQNLQMQRSLYRDVVMYPDAASKQKARDGMAKTREQYAEIIKTIETHFTTYPVTPEVKQLLNTMATQQKLAEPIIDKMMDAGMTGNTQAAITVMETELIPTVRPWREAIEALVKAEQAQVMVLMNKTDSTYHTSLLVLAGGTAVVVVIALLFSVLISRSIVIPLSEAVAAVTHIAAGNLSTSVPAGGKDEAGSVLTAMSGMANRLSDSVRKVNTSAHEISAVSESLAQAAAQMLTASHGQSQSSASSAAAIEQLTHSIAHIADSTDTLRKEAKTALESSRNGTAKLDTLVAEVNQVETIVQNIASAVGSFLEKSREISNMTKEVRDIADQTNLLALNAAIEAARAGEQGRGFAVVADEVRKLAEKSASSAGEIDDVTSSLDQHSHHLEKSITDGMTALASSRRVVQDVASGLHESHTAVEHSTQRADEIAVAVMEQRQSSEDLVKNIETVATAAEENCAVIASINKQLQQVVGVSRTLNDSIRFFKV